VKLLLDTHALIWLIVDDARIGRQAREVIVDLGNEVFVSIVSFWEFAVLLHLDPHHVVELIKLPFHPDHRDPFDHQLIAQAVADWHELGEGGPGVRLKKPAKKPK
jgi:PIN domain nuclease of toxin-antitoxin system